MPIVSGYQYDIFISYRHNDNRSNWVTEFVNALLEESSATIKESGLREILNSKNWEKKLYSNG